VSDQVSFAGNLPAGAPVRRMLDAADMFVLPSRTEGLPRALIEAMARGLPCVATDVGGIPELLVSEDLVPAGDAMSLAAKLMSVLGNPQRRAAMSARNLEKAREFHYDALSLKRRDFYTHLQLQTQAAVARRVVARESAAMGISS
jgi:glycosyltransferase involved in cell wall biosynthesis